nr:MAG TPA: hypothetical protein [Caudoviricetes sp.]
MKYLSSWFASGRVRCIIGLSGGKHRNGRNETVNPMSRYISDYLNKLNLCYSVRDNSFTVEIMGEEYTIHRCGMRYWKCAHNGFTTIFKSQWEVITWLDSRW